MTFLKRIFYFAHHPGQWIGSQQANKNKDAVKGGDEKVFWSGSVDRHTAPEHTTPNVQSLDKKVDEIRARVAFQRDIRDCNVLCFTETSLNRDAIGVGTAIWFLHASRR